VSLWTSRDCFGPADPSNPWHLGNRVGNHSMWQAANLVETEGPAGNSVAVSATNSVPLEPATSAGSLLACESQLRSIRLDCGSLPSRLRESQSSVDSSWFESSPTSRKLRSLAEWEVTVAIDDASRQLSEQGVALLRNVFEKGPLIRLTEAAAECFEVIAAGTSLPQRFSFSRSSHSVLLAALLDFGCNDMEQLMAPLSVPGLEQLLSDAMGAKWVCKLDQSWVRKKFAPSLAPAVGYHLQNWHQDGALGARFPVESGSVIPMTELLTCWIPLNPCGVHSPGLEFIRRRQPALLHFSELDDSALRGRFSAEEFWAPTLAFGDGLVFLNGTLHRTYTRPEMLYNRLSVEYRIFPG
jgi:hypothetical protein